MLQRWARLSWSRAVYAQLVDQLCNAGAQLIIFDMMFDPERDGDDEFAAALERHRDRVVIGADIEKGANAATGNTDIIFIPPNKHLIPDQFMDDRVGYVSFWPGADNRIREINYAVTDSQILRLQQGLDPGRRSLGKRFTNLLMHGHCGSLGSVIAFLQLAARA